MNNKSYRIKTVPGKSEDIYFDINLLQDYNSIDILSLNLTESNAFKLHSSNYGIVVGRVIANGGFGVPNAKVSIFIEADSETLSNIEESKLYPYSNVMSKGDDKRRYNLLPNYKVDKFYQAVGSMPSKEFILNNDEILSVFEKYYVLSTRTNSSGDYFISGVPIGQHQIHMDVDLSDCGILSQKPRDFVYKGYSIEQFDSPNKFKKSEDLDSLSQIFSQNQTINVIPFWGNEDISGDLGITRADIELSFKFEPTCVFMGCLVGDDKNEGISGKCIPTPSMGAMDELVSGEGKIEIIRKRIDGTTEGFQIKGNEVIDANGVWCYQIPMNLDYMITDEYGNIIPSDEPLKGLPTRTRVRFRVSMHEFDENNDFYYRSKILVPNNPQNNEEIDYVFGTGTKETSYRDLFWDNIYTVKSYIPRFQKQKNVRRTNFTGIKHSNIYGANNPIPYNNIRIRLPFLFTLLCSLIKAFLRIVGFLNFMLYKIAWFMPKKAKSFKYITVGNGLCPDMDGWYFAPGGVSPEYGHNDRLIEKKGVDLLKQTFLSLFRKNQVENGGDEKDEAIGKDYNLYETIRDNKSIDEKNNYTDDKDEVGCLTIDSEYLVSCIEMNLAEEYKVINFDFYNDWINGMLYFPRWMRKIRKKQKFFFGIFTLKEKVRGCMDDPTIFSRNRYYTQQCALTFKENRDFDSAITDVSTKKPGCSSKEEKQRCHSNSGMKQVSIFGRSQGGIVHGETTTRQQVVYYLKPCEFFDDKTSRKNKKVNLFATDLVLLGSVKECNLYGIPQAFNGLSSTSYKMPTNLALTNLEDAANVYFDAGSGTICDQQEYKKGAISHINTNEADQSFSKNKKIKKGQVDFSGEDDAIPVTEASGIAWNYSGPGQGTNDLKHLYFPGGHFLGLSCTNSETNIKTCVNLTRICEQGAEISQRREEVRNVNGDNLEHYYVIPSGLIAEDEISSMTFRSMFSSLNSFPLIANEIDRNTGFPTYSFLLMRQTGFNGEFTNIIKDNFYYNHKLVMSSPSPSTKSAPSSSDTQGTRSGMMNNNNNRDENRDFENNYNFMVDNGDDSSHGSSGDSGKWWENDSIGKGFYVKDEVKAKELGIDETLDYDSNETDFMFNSTRENVNLDYYHFRFGLNPNVSGYRENASNNKFLIESNGEYSLPQYENSFYFYFGIKEGATALDKLLKEFYSSGGDDSGSKTVKAELIHWDNFEEKYDFDEGIENRLKLKLYNMEAPVDVKVVCLNGNHQRIRKNGGSGKWEVSAHFENVDDIYFDLYWGIYNIKIKYEGEKIYTLYNCLIGPEPPIYFGDEFDFKTIDAKNLQPQKLAEYKIGNKRLPVGGYIDTDGCVEFLENKFDVVGIDRHKKGYSNKPVAEGENIYSLIITSQNNYCTFNFDETKYKIREDIITNDSGERKGKIEMTQATVENVSELIENDQENSSSIERYRYFYRIGMWDCFSEYEVYFGFKHKKAKKFIFFLVDKFKFNGPPFFDVFHGGKNLPFRNKIYEEIPGNWWESCNLGACEGWFGSTMFGNALIWQLKHYTFQQNLDFFENKMETQVYTYSTFNKASKLYIFGCPEYTDENGIVKIKKEEGGKIKEYCKDDARSYSGCMLDENMISIPTYWPNGNYTVAEKFLKENGYQDVEIEKNKKNYGAICFLPPNEFSANPYPIDYFKIENVSAENYKYNTEFSASTKGSEIFGGEKMKNKHILVNLGEQYYPFKLLVTDIKNENNKIKLSLIDENGELDTILKEKFPEISEIDTNNILLYSPYQIPIIYSPFYADGNTFWYPSYKLNFESTALYSTMDVLIKNIRVIPENNILSLDVAIHNGIMIENEPFENKNTIYTCNEETINNPYEVESTAGSKDIIRRRMAKIFNMKNVREANFDIEEELPRNYSELLYNLSTFKRGAINFSVFDNSLYDIFCTQHIVKKIGDFSPDYVYYKIPKSEWGKLTLPKQRYYVFAKTLNHFIPGDILPMETSGGFSFQPKEVIVLFRIDDVIAPIGFTLSKNEDKAIITVKNYFEDGVEKKEEIEIKIKEFSWEKVIMTFAKNHENRNAVILNSVRTSMLKDARNFQTSLIEYLKNIENNEEIIELSDENYSQLTTNDFVIAVEKIFMEDLRNNKPAEGSQLYSGKMGKINNFKIYFNSNGRDFS